MGDHLVHQVYDKRLVAKRDVDFGHQFKHEPEEKQQQTHGGIQLDSAATLVQQSKHFHAEKTSFLKEYMENSPHFEKSENKCKQIHSSVLLSSE